MPELRYNLISGGWVVIATERAKRPKGFVKEKAEVKKAHTPKDCPFCYGNEKLTPPEVFAIRPKNSKPDTPGWKLRVVPNKYPAFQNASENFLLTEDNLFKKGKALGFHEVIVFSPHHEKDIDKLSLEQTKLIVSTFKERYNQLKKEKNAKYILIIINKGKEAGASLPHPHAQLFTTPIIPEVIEKELKTSKKYFEEKGRCLFCDIVREEKKKKERVVFETEKFIALSPFASRVPFEILLLPKNHRAFFEEINSKETEELAKIIRKVLTTFSRKLGDIPYNFFLHTNPPKIKAKDYYHYHIEILPRLSTVAGFEMGAGIMINIVRPEEASAFLRSRV